jgi:hypothetical protein
MNRWFVRTHSRSALFLGVLCATLGVGLWACSSNDAARPDEATSSVAADVKKDGGADAARDAAEAGVVLTAERIVAVRACMEARWGAAPTRPALDVADDFDSCTTAGENSGALGDSNFVSTVAGWAEPDPADHSRMRRIVSVIP